jgi:uncharacterized protein involved in exopolysaccharide biosynthesis
MESSHAASLPPRELMQLVWSRRRFWMTTTVACGLLAAAYSLVMPRYWEASQGLVVRQETAGATASRPGKFADLYEMRTLQETILELAKSQQVVVATLKAVDGAATEPTLQDIDEFRKRLKMLPPDGGEFGKTEVFYFTLKAKSRERAIQLVSELCKQLEAALKQLRTERAASLIAELEEEAKLAEDTLAAETQRLMEFEAQVGSDLGELRMLHSANAGQSDLRLEAVQLETDVRKFRTQVREFEKLIALLKAAQEDPQQLIATPNSLLETQPAIRRLKDGLVDAQLATSRLGGTRSADHPKVRAAIEAERQIRADLHEELVTAIRGAEVELQLGRDRLAATEDRLANLENRFTQLAEERAEYSNRIAAVDNCRQTLDRARQNLSTAKAALAAASSSSLVTRLDEPETGPYAAGPGRTVIAGAGAAAGLLLGLGLVFLTAAPKVEGKSLLRRRASDRVIPQPLVDVAAADPPLVPPAESVPTNTAPDAPAAAVVDAPLDQPEPVVATDWWSVTPEPLPREEPEEDVSVEKPSQAHDPAPSAAEDFAVPTTVTSLADEPRRKREPEPTAASAAPAVVGSLAGVGAESPFGGMSLQEALQAAARQMST